MHILFKKISAICKDDIEMSVPLPLHAVFSEVELCIHVCCVQAFTHHHKVSLLTFSQCSNIKFTLCRMLALIALNSNEHLHNVIYLYFCI